MLLNSDKQTVRQSNLLWSNAGSVALYPLNRECISRMCRTYLEWLTLHKTAVKKPRDRRQTVPPPQRGGRVRAYQHANVIKETHPQHHPAINVFSNVVSVCLKDPQHTSLHHPLI